MTTARQIPVCRAFVSSDRSNRTLRGGERHGQENHAGNLLRDAHEKGGFTGAWLYAGHGGIISKGAVGFRDAENTLPIREDAIFDIASVSKQFMAAAIMLLRRRGALTSTTT